MSTPTNIIAFPNARRETRAAQPDAGDLAVLRRCARRAHVAGRLDLEALAATQADDPELWGAALLQASARARRDLVTHRSGAASPSECWLAQLIAALRAGDEDSARFIVERHLRRSERRLAMCFAQRLAHGPALARSA